MTINSRDYKVEIDSPYKRTPCQAVGSGTEEDNRHVLLLSPITRRLAIGSGAVGSKTSLFAYFTLLIAVLAGTVVSLPSVFSTYESVFTNRQLDPSVNLHPVLHEYRYQRGQQEVRNAGIVSEANRSQRSPASSDSAAALQESTDRYVAALFALREGGTDVTLSRAYYASLAEVSQLTFEADSAPESTLSKQIALSKVREIYEDEDLYQLTSSAAAAWIAWPDRRSNGVVLAGTVERVYKEGNDFIAELRMRDAARSLLSVATSSRIDELLHQEAILVGLITPSSEQTDNMANYRLQGVLVRKSPRRTTPEILLGANF